MRKTFTFFLAVIIFALSCSTEKNTLFTRAYHNLTAHYNVFFNAKTALQDGIKNIEQKCQYNYYNILPIFPYQCPNAKNLALAKMNRTLEKSAKTIANHSITAKPNFKNLRNLTPAQLKFYKKYEYVKWIDDSYLLIGIANLYKGEITKSQQAFHKILDKYSTENTTYDARLWLARTYILQGRYKDAENYLNQLQKDKNLPRRLHKDLYITYADLYIQQKLYKKAIPFLTKAIKLEKNRRIKAKYTFILAQLQLETGDISAASESFKKVAKYNPPYELEFHAQLYRATALGSKDNPEQIRKKLLKMVKDEKNKEYKDRIYYALAQLDLQTKDTSSALKNFQLAVQNSTNSTQKGLIYLTLADLYFKQHNYLIAGKYYDSTLQTLPKNYKDYKTIQTKSKSLIDLAKNLEIISLQDSLQRLAKLPKDKLNKIIDSIIQAKKQQQQKAKQAQNFQSYDFMDYDARRYASGLPTPQNQGGKWYFYNPMLVSRGKQIFRQRWGDRKLEDNWRRKVKTAVSGQENLAFENETEQTQKTDQTSRDYYLKQIPLTDSAKAASDQKIIESLFNIAIIYENQLNEPQNAIKTYLQLLQRYPENQYKLDTYYHLYLLYSKTGNQTKAQYYKQQIIQNFPNSKYALMLTSPDYAKKIKAKELAAQNLLLNTIKLYDNFNYTAVIDSANYALKNYSTSAIIPYILVLKAKAYGSLGNIDSLKNILDFITKNYPTDPIAKYAKKILTQISTGSLNIAIYKFNPDEKHLLVIFTNTKNQKKLNELKFNIYKLANEYSKDKVYSAQLSKIGKQNVIILQYFDNLAEAQNFITYFKNNWQEKTNWLLFSQTNFNTFKNDQDLIKYQIFYEKYYKSLSN